MFRVCLLACSALIQSCALAMDVSQPTPAVPSPVDVVVDHKWAILDLAKAPADAPIFVSGLAFSPSGQKLCVVVGNERDGSAVLVIDVHRQLVVARSDVVVWGSADDAIWSDELHLSLAGHADPHSMQSFVLALGVRGRVIEVLSKTPVVVPHSADNEHPLPGMAARLDLKQGKTIVVGAVPLLAGAAPPPAKPMAAPPGITLDELGKLLVDDIYLLEAVFSPGEDDVLANPAAWRGGDTVHAAVGRGGLERAELAIVTVDLGLRSQK